MGWTMFQITPDGESQPSRSWTEEQAAAFHVLAIFSSILSATNEDSQLGLSSLQFASFQR